MAVNRAGSHVERSAASILSPLGRSARLLGVSIGREAVIAARAIMAVDVRGESLVAGTKATVRRRW
jgi:serine acetyltransferase